MAAHLTALARGNPVARPLPPPQGGVPGPTLTLDESDYLIRPGQRVAEAVLELTLRSSRGGLHRILLPRDAELQQVTVDGRERPLRLEGQGLGLPLVPWTQQVRIRWRQPDALVSYYSPSVPNLGTGGVNATTRIELGRDHSGSCSPAVPTWVRPCFSEAWWSCSSFWPSDWDVAGSRR